MKPEPFGGWLSGVPRTHPALAGFDHLLAELHDDATKTGSQLGLSGEDRAFLDGRQSALQDVMEQLAQSWQDAQRGPVEATDLTGSD